MNKEMTKRILSIMLSLALIFTMMPMVPGTVDKASAATNYITKVELNYDLSYIDLHTAWTKGEVNARVKSSMSTTTAGVAISDSSNSGLRYTPEGSSQMWGIGDGTGQIDSTSTYYIEYYLNPLNGYNWTLDTMKGNGLTVIANGENITSDVIFEYNATWNGLSVFVPIGKASTKAKVTGVEIDGGDISLEKGGSHVFTGEVKGNIKDKLILWSVEGNTSVNTKITSAGKLTIGEDETAESIYVVATANANILKRARVKVAVLDSAPTINSITVKPNDSEVLQGKRKQFDAFVEGTQLDKRVTWSVEGALDAETTIDENGYLKVGIDETAESITVRATSYVDPSKSGAVTVKIVPLNKISRLELSYDFKNIDLNTAWTEGEVDDRVLSCIATTTDGVIVSISSNSGLSYIPEGSSTMHGISDGNGQVDVTKSYYIRYNLSLTSSDYEWITTAKDGNGTGLTIIANGTDITSDAIIQYSSYWNDMIVYVPIGSVSTSPIVKTVTVTPDSVELLQGTSQKFNVNVLGTQVDKSVSWSVLNAKSDKTTIDQSGNLMVGNDEKAETIIVKATANQDPKKSGIATVIVKPCIRINEVNLIYDFDVIDLNVLSTEGEVQTRVRDTINTTTEDVKVNTSNSWLMYKLEGGNFSGIGDGTNLVKADQTYYIEYGLEIPKGYHWAYGVSEGDYSGLTVKVNGVDKTEEIAEFSTNTSTGMLYVVVPLDKAKLVNIDRAEVVLSASSYTYDGKAKTPTVTVNDGEKVLVKDVDYTISYENNVNVGTATATITGIGNYTGTITKSFVITLIAPTNVKVSNVASSGKPKLTWDAVEGADKYYVYRSGTKDGAYTYLRSTTGTSYEDTSAKTGYVYYYKVRAVYSANEDLNSVQSSYAYTRCDLPQPTGLKVTNVASSGKPKVTWTAVDGADKYYVYRSGTKDGTYTYLRSTTETSYEDTTAKGGYVYYYKVRAVYSANENANSALSSYTYTRCDLAQPTGLKITNVGSSGKPKITWTAVERADKYYVYRSGTKDGTYTYLRSTTGTSYEDTSAKGGYVYYYKVKAVYSANENANSALSSYTYTRCDLAQPTGLKITNVASSGKPNITWTAVERADKYYVYRADTKDGTYTYLRSTTGTSYEDTTAVAGNLYYYKVRAVYSANENANSIQSSYTYTRCDLPQPKASITLSTKGKPSVTWDAVSGASKYEIWRKVGSGEYVKYHTQTGTSFTNSSTTAGTTYYYKVIAVCGTSTSGNSAYSNEVSITSK